MPTLKSTRPFMFSSKLSNFRTQQTSNFSDFRNLQILRQFYNFITLQVYLVGLLLNKTQYDTVLVKNTRYLDFLYFFFWEIKRSRTAVNRSNKGWRETCTTGVPCYISRAGGIHGSGDELFTSVEHHPHQYSVRDPPRNDAPAAHPRDDQ